MSTTRRDEALASLVGERGQALTRYALLLTGDLAAAQDLVQDALVKVFVRTRAGFAPQTLEAYVRRAIVNLYIDGHRRNRQWNDVAHLLARGETIDAADTAACLDLRAALHTLSPQERTVIVLRYFDDLPIAGVAEHMGLATGTVKRYLSNAVTKLEDRLGPMPSLGHDDVEPAPVLPHGRRD